MYNEQIISTMKIKLFTTAFLALFAIAFLSEVSAQATPNVSRKQVQQHKQIRKGAKSGELTKAEIIRLKKQQKNIQYNKKVAKADGKVTPKERAVIRSKQRAASRNIRRQSNDAQTRRR